MKNLKACIDMYTRAGEVQNIAIRAGNRDKLFCDIYHHNKNKIDNTTLFDMASVTKIMVTATLILIAADRNLLNINDTISKFYDVPDDKINITVKHLLTHTMGIGHKALNVEGNSYDNIHKYILSLPSDVKIGKEVLYSCPGYILLAKVAETVFNDRLDNLFIKHIANPLGMTKSGFMPNKNNNFVNSNLSDAENGLVNDYNCRFLGGITGNAGLFSNMNDICKYINMLQNFGEPIISRETFNMATINHTADMSESRGLGFLYVDEKYTQTGKLFPKGSIGHCGHTGQSVFVDLKSGLYVAILSDATISGVRKYGCEKYDVVMKMREDIHNAIYEDLKKAFL